MARFFSQTFSDGADISLELGNEEWVRQMVISNNWNHIRIGLLYQVTGTANTTNAGTNFAVGICSGTGAPFGVLTTTNFVGIECVNVLGWVANAGQPYYSYASSNLFACKKVGGSVTTAATNLADSVGLYVPTIAGAARRGLLYVDITKGTPNYTIGISAPPNTSAASDWTVPFLVSGMTQTFGSIVVNSVSMSTGNGAQTLACDETAGIFDTVDIYSNLLSNPFEIQEVAIEKLA